MPNVSTIQAENIRKIIGKGGVRATAKALNISPQSVSNILAGKEVTSDLLNRVLDYVIALKKSREEKLSELSKAS